MYFSGNSDDSNIDVFCCSTELPDSPILRSVVHCYCCCCYFRYPTFCPTDILGTHWPADLRPKCDLCCRCLLQLPSNRLCRQSKALDSFRCEHRHGRCTSEILSRFPTKKKEENVLPVFVANTDYKIPANHMIHLHEKSKHGPWQTLIEHLPLQTNNFCQDSVCPIN